MRAAHVRHRGAEIERREILEAARDALVERFARGAVPVVLHAIEDRDVVRAVVRFAVVAVAADDAVTEHERARVKQDVVGQRVGPAGLQGVGAPRIAAVP